VNLGAVKIVDGGLACISNPQITRIRQEVLSLIVRRLQSLPLDITSIALFQILRARAAVTREYVVSLSYFAETSFISRFPMSG
jgi:hypothetical protein